MAAFLYPCGFGSCLHIDKNSLQPDQSLATKPSGISAHDEQRFAFHEKRQDMLKSGKLSSELQLKKETLQGFGYTFDSISKKSGWSWSAVSDASTSNASSEAEVIQDAWQNAGEKAQNVLNIPLETWQRMAAKEQKEMIEEAFTEN